MLTHLWEGYHVCKLPPPPFMRVTIDRKMIVQPQYYVISSITLASKKIMYNRILQEGAMQTRLLPRTWQKQCANHGRWEHYFCQARGNNHLCEAAECCINNNSSIYIPLIMFPCLRLWHECCIAFIICLSITRETFFKVDFIFTFWFVTYEITCYFTSTFLNQMN